MNTSLKKKIMSGLMLSSMAMSTFASPVLANAEQPTAETPASDTQQHPDKKIYDVYKSGSQFTVPQTGDYTFVSHGGNAEVTYQQGGNVQLHKMNGDKGRDYKHVQLEAGTVINVEGDLDSLVSLVPANEFKSYWLDTTRVIVGIRHVEGDSVQISYLNGDSESYRLGTKDEEIVDTPIEDNSAPETETTETTDTTDTTDTTEQPNVSDDKGTEQSSNTHSEYVEDTDKALDGLFDSNDESESTQTDEQATDTETNDQKTQTTETTSKPNIRLRFKKDHTMESGKKGSLIELLDSEGNTIESYFIVDEETLPDVSIPELEEKQPEQQPEQQEQKPDEQKPDEQKPDEQKPDEQKPDEQKPDEQKPDEQKPDEQKPDEQKPDEQKPDEQKPENKDKDKNGNGEFKPNGDSPEKNDKQDRRLDRIEKELGLEDIDKPSDNVDKDASDYDKKQNERLKAIEDKLGITQDKDKESSSYDKTQDERLKAIEEKLGIQSGETDKDKDKETDKNKDKGNNNSSSGSSNNSSSGSSNKSNDDKDKDDKDKDDKDDKDKKDNKNNKDNKSNSGSSNNSNNKNNSSSNNNSSNNNSSSNNQQLTVKDGKIQLKKGTYHIEKNLPAGQISILAQEGKGRFIIKDANGKEVAHHRMDASLAENQQQQNNQNNTNQQDRDLSRQSENSNQTFNESNKDTGQFQAEDNDRRDRTASPSTSDSSVDLTLSDGTRLEQPQARQHEKDGTHVKGIILDNGEKVYYNTDNGYYAYIGVRQDSDDQYFKDKAAAEGAGFKEATGKPDDSNFLQYQRRQEVEDKDNPAKKKVDVATLEKGYTVEVTDSLQVEVTYLNGGKFEQTGMEESHTVRNVVLGTLVTLGALIGGTLLYKKKQSDESAELEKKSQ